MPRAALLLALLALPLPLAAPGRLLAEPAPAAPAPAPTAALGFLEGLWRAEAGADAWEAAYTGTGGAEVLGATKQVRAGRTASFSFERFAEREGRLVLALFPGGKAGPELPLKELDAKAGKAVFENPASPFPLRVTYHRTGQDALTVTLEGDAANAARRLVLVFKARQG